MTHYISGRKWLAWGENVLQKSKSFFCSNFSSTAFSKKIKERNGEKTENKKRNTCKLIRHIKYQGRPQKWLKV